MKYKAVLFDMDGTVLDTLEDLKDAVNVTLRAYGMPERSLEEVRCFVGNGALRLFEQAVAPGSSQETVMETLAYFKDYYDRHCLIKTAPYDGIMELLAELKAQGVKLAVVSNKPHSAVMELSRLFFSDYMEYSMGQQDFIARKPAPDMLWHTVERMGLELSDCVYIGDSEVDVATAKNAGMDGIAVSWGFRTVAELEAAGAKCIVHSTEELLELLQ